ncbi:hypothetical protein BKA93DRAFT_560519 [Sparassis latifolia]
MGVHQVDPNGQPGELARPRVCTSFGADRRPYVPRPRPPSLPLDASLVLKYQCNPHNRYRNNDPHATLHISPINNFRPQPISCIHTSRPVFPVSRAIKCKYCDRLDAAAISSRLYYVAAPPVINTRMYDAAPDTRQRCTLIDDARSPASNALRTRQKSGRSTSHSTTKTHHAAHRRTNRENDKERKQEKRKKTTRKSMQKYPVPPQLLYLARSPRPALSPRVARPGISAGISPFPRVLRKRGRLGARVRTYAPV